MMGQTITSPGIHLNKYKIDVNFFFQNLFTSSAENFTKTMYLNWLIQKWMRRQKPIGYLARTISST